jgi:hypothetical protein
MLVCGREEPIRPNEHIYQGIERVDRLVLSDVEDDRLNRYSFVWLGSRDDASEKLTLLLQVVLSAWGAGGSWLAAYDTGGQVATRSRLHLAKRKKEGWDTVDDGTLGIAVRAIDHMEKDATVDDTIRLSPRHELQYAGLRWDSPVLVIGRAFSASSVARAATRSALARLAIWSMTPTRKFLGWLARTERTLIYTAKSHANHPGIIVVGTRRIGVEDLVSTGLVSSIEDGDNAGDVWWHAPNWPEPTKEL